jgi:Ca-activated chloride channel family protein
MLLALSVASIFAVHGSSGATPPDRDDDERRHRMKISAPSPSASFDMAAEMGATPGGAQDIGSARDHIERGGVPHPNTFTPEGLFSEHDLPLRPGNKCHQLLCVGGEATEVQLLAQPDAQYLAQIGFSSGLDPATFQRAPLNLVFVVDTSGSMSHALPLVRDSLLEVLEHLDSGDRVSIVVYESTAYSILPPTPANERRKIKAAIRKLESAGSTAMEDGLAEGFRVARKSKKGFLGSTRLMLFTDERPNVGRTDAQSFMGMARKGSRNGIGMTTIGVSTHFGAELAQQVSSVRGGNLFFFPDVQKMKDVFEDEFDTLVTELAYDMELVVQPSKGMKIEGVYGIPGSALRWNDSGGIELGIETIFLSRKKGAIFVALASDGSSNLPSKRVSLGDPVGRVSLSYQAADSGRPGSKASDRVRLTHVARGREGAGLERGRMLVNQVTAMKEAARRHHEENDQEGAYQLVHALAGLYRQNGDPELAGERETVIHLEATLAKASGHQGEPSSSQSTQDPVSGLPKRRRRAPRTRRVAAP